MHGVWPGWDNHLLRLELRRRGPRASRDLVWWLLGWDRRLLCFWLLPVLALTATSAIGRLPADSLGFPLLLFPLLVPWVVCVVAMVIVPGLVCLVSAAQSAAGDWQQGKAQEWQLTPMDRTMWVSAKAWGRVLPLGAALTSGCIPAGLLWMGARPLGWPVPPLLPTEGLLLATEAWFVLLCMAYIGTQAGVEMRNTVSATFLALRECALVTLFYVPLMLYGIWSMQLGYHVAAVALVWSAGLTHRNKAALQLGEPAG